MRIVSQDKSKDIPYDNQIIMLDEDGSNCINVWFDGSFWIIGQYSSKEKALKVMEMIELANMCKSVDDEILENFGLDKFVNSISFTNNNLEVCYFNMPQDDEVTLD